MKLYFLALSLLSLTVYPQTLVDNLFKTEVRPTIETRLENANCKTNLDELIKEIRFLSDYSDADLEIKGKFFSLNEIENALRKTKKDCRKKSL